MLTTLFLWCSQVNHTFAIVYTLLRFLFSYSYSILNMSKQTLLHKIKDKKMTQTTSKIYIYSIFLLIPIELCFMAGYVGPVQFMVTLIHL